MKSRMRKLRTILMILLSFLLPFSCSDVNLVAPALVEEGEDGDIDNDGTLDAQDSDIDGDGLSNTDEINLFGTNPRRADTDGDGWNDATEVLTYDASSDPYRFSPLIADQPRIQLIIAGVPDIGYIKTSTTGTSTEESFTEGKSITSGRTVSNKNTSTTKMEHEWSLETEVGQEVKLGTTNTYTVVWNATAGVKGSYAQESAYEWGEEWSASNTSEFEKASTYARTNEISYQSGYIRVPVYIRNNGDVGYTITAVSVSSYALNPYSSESLSMVGNLDFQSGSGFTSLTIPPGEQKGPFYFENTGLDIGLIPGLTTKAAAVVTAVSGYTITITDDNGTTHDFSGTSTNVAALCTEVAIDYGPGLTPEKDAEKYMVATRTKFNPDYTSLDNLYFAATLDEVLGILHITFAEDQTGVYTGLSSLNGIANDSARRAYWYVCVQDDGSDTVTLYSVKLRSFDLGGLEVHPGQKVSFIYSVDADNDGLPLRIEELIGSSDSIIDSDGDNIRDYDEVKGWERNGALYATNPALADTDRDDLNDDVDPIPTSRVLFATTTIGSVSIKSADQASVLSTASPSGTDITTSNVSRASFVPVITTADPVSTVKIGGILLSADSTGEVWTGGVLPLAVSPDGSGNSFEVKVTSEQGTTTTTYALKVPSALADVGSFSFTQGILASSGGVVHVPLNPQAVWTNQTDTRVQGVLLFWANTSGTYPASSSPAVTRSVLDAGYRDSLPDLDTRYSTNSNLIQKADGSGSLSTVQGLYYNKSYYFKLFTYAQIDGKYYYSDGVTANVDPSDPSVMTIKVDALYYDVYDLDDDPLEDSAASIDMAIDIAVGYNIAYNSTLGLYLPTTYAATNLERDSGNKGNEWSDSWDVYAGYVDENIAAGRHDFPANSDTTFDVTVPSDGRIFWVATYARECDWWGNSSYSDGEDIILVYNVYTLTSLETDGYASYSGVKSVSVYGDHNFFYWGGSKYFFDSYFNKTTIYYEFTYTTKGVQ